MPFGGEPNPIADSAEGVADRRDDADAALATIAKLESRGRRRPLIRNRLEWKLAADSLDDVPARDHGIHRPDAVGIQRPELDEPHFIPLAARKFPQGQDLLR